MINPIQELLEELEPYFSALAALGYEETDIHTHAQQIRRREFDVREDSQSKELYLDYALYLANFHANLHSISMENLEIAREFNDGLMLGKSHLLGVFHRGIKYFPTDSGMSLQLIAVAIAYGSLDSLDTLLAKALDHCPQCPELYLIQSALATYWGNDAASTRAIMLGFRSSTEVSLLFKAAVRSELCKSAKDLRQMVYNLFTSGTEKDRVALIMESDSSDTAIEKFKCESKSLEKRMSRIIAYINKAIIDITDPSVVLMPVLTEILCFICDCKLLYSIQALPVVVEGCKKALEILISNIINLANSGSNEHWESIACTIALIDLEVPILNEKRNTINFNTHENYTLSDLKQAYEQCQIRGSVFKLDLPNIKESLMNFFTFSEQNTIDTDIDVIASAKVLSSFTFLSSDAMLTICPHLPTLPEHAKILYGNCYKLEKVILPEGKLQNLIDTIHGKSIKPNFESITSALENLTNTLNALKYSNCNSYKSLFQQHLNIFTHYFNSKIQFSVDIQRADEDLICPKASATFTLDIIESYCSLFEITSDASLGIRRKQFHDLSHNQSENDFSILVTFLISLSRGLGMNKFVKQLLFNAQSRNSKYCLPCIYELCYPLMKNTGEIALAKNDIRNSFKGYLVYTIWKELPLAAAGNWESFEWLKSASGVKQLIKSSSSAEEIAARLIDALTEIKDEYSNAQMCSAETGVSRSESNSKTLLANEVWSLIFIIAEQFQVPELQSLRSQYAIWQKLPGNCLTT